MAAPVIAAAAGVAVLVTRPAPVASLVAANGPTIQVGDNGLARYLTTSPTVRSRRPPTCPGTPPRSRPPART
ncbi:hypothetical protein ACFQX7_09630 [Luedemannella flava]